MGKRLVTNVENVIYSHGCRSSHGTAISLSTCVQVGHQGYQGNRVLWFICASSHLPPRHISVILFNDEWLELLWPWICAGGGIEVASYISSTNQVQFTWNGFQSNVGMFLYFAALSTQPVDNSSCQVFVSLYSSLHSTDWIRLCERWFVWV